MLNITKVIIPRVKTQAKGQNDWSRALNEILYAFVAQVFFEIQQYL